MVRHCVLILALVLARPVPAETIAGPVAVVDGDTLDVGTLRVRLHGIDAPEHDQTCTRASGAAWACGRWATERLRAAFGGARATCERLDTDRYGRAVARCEVGGRDIGGALVTAGAAVAYRRYSLTYLAAESEASAAGRGLWSGAMVAPEVFRRSDVAAAAPAPEGCAIKGNISSRGRIFHRPGQAYYARTRINRAAGERWFCSVEAARAAGWRAARG